MVTAAAKSLRLFFCIFSLNSNSPHNLSRGTFSDPPCAAGPRPAPPDWPAGGRHRRQWRPLGSFSSLFSTSFIVKKGEPRAGGARPTVTLLWRCAMEEKQKETKESKKERKTPVNSHLANKQEVKQLVWVDRFRQVCFFSLFFLFF